MAIRIGINGFGRIGRMVARIMMQRGNYQIVGINDLTETAALAHLFKYDSVAGKYKGNVSVDGNIITIDNQKIETTAIKNPAELPWKKMNVDMVIESTGVFTKKADISLHLSAGAPKVLLTVPAKDEIDATIVCGVNDSDLKKEHKIISNASCTTNCLAPVAKVLHENFGIKEGLMTTIHAYTNDQRIADLVHKDLRRARAAAQNIIPTSTGAAKAVGKVIPALNGRLNGVALRVPVIDGSLVDLVFNTEKPTTVEAINEAIKKAAETSLKGIVEYCTDPIVSSDIIGNENSSIFDALSTMAIGKNFFKIFSWYDNEWGYSNRVVDLIEKAVKLGN